MGKSKKKNYYAVHRGRKVGIFKSWPECESSVKGYTGARYKGFGTLDEAQSFVNSGSSPALPVSKKEEASSASPVRKSEYVIYTDGGCIGNTNVLENRTQPAGWGVVIEYPLNQKPNEEMYGPVEIDATHSDFLGAQVKSNNTGELSAIAHALQWLQSRDDTLPAIICYDSKYAANITQSIWVAKKNLALARTCQRLFSQVSSRRSLTFQHVKGHSGNAGNERADALVQLGCQGLRSTSPPPSTGAHSRSSNKKHQIIDLTHLS